jgi:hypothetical protein
LCIEWFVRVWVVRVVFDSQQPFLEGREDAEVYCPVSCDGTRATNR